VHNAVAKWQGFAARLNGRRHAHTRLRKGYGGHAKNLARDSAQDFDLASFDKLRMREVDYFGGATPSVVFCVTSDMLQAHSFAVVL
jgi:hypothetical protein